MVNKFPMRLDYYQYAAETWQQIFNEIDFLKIKNIIDLCPGWSPKIEMALTKTSFLGKLIIIDKSAENISNFQKLFTPFLHKFEIKTTNIDLFKDSNYLLKPDFNCDLMVVNHVVDDLVFDLFLSKYNLGFSRESIFEEPNLMKEIWVKISKNKIIFEETEAILKNMFLNMVNPLGYVFIAQYLGYQENLYGLDEIYIKCSSVIKNITKGLIKENYFIDKELLLDRAFTKMVNPYFPLKDITCLQRNS